MKQRYHKAFIIPMLIVVLTFNLAPIQFAVSNSNVWNSGGVISTCNYSIPVVAGNEDYMGQESPDWDLMKEKMNVKGIYITGNTVSVTSRFNQLIDLVRQTELNAIVLDVKDDEGFMTYRSGLEKVQFVGGNGNVRIRDVDGVMRTLENSDIYPIARIVTFKDKRAADKFPHLAIKNRGGGIWRDRNGMAWLNPYNRESWEYVVSIAEEAVTKGFKEIQFDYVRFPTDGKMDAIDYGSQAVGKSKAEAISGFLAYARERLSKKGVVISADVFGLVTTVKDDMRIGQNLEAISRSVDVICPMVYPSHYAKGSYGVKEPDFEPYRIVNHSMKVAKDRIDSMASHDKAVLRPWLQDFTASYLPRYKRYGADEVRAQIRAAYDAGVDEWILWNAGNRYTSGALNR